MPQRDNLEEEFACWRIAGTQWLLMIDHGMVAAIGPLGHDERNALFEATGSAEYLEDDDDDGA